MYYTSSPLHLQSSYKGFTVPLMLFVYKGHVPRIWDVNATTGRYLSPDFVIDDAKPNKDEFRIFKNAPFVVEFDGETSVRKESVKSDGFIGYPFEFVELENLEVTNNKYMIGKGIRDRLYLSSNSSTLIIDDDSIPALKKMKTYESGVETGKQPLPVDFSEVKADTLENLLMWGRNRKIDVCHLL
ncbi:hypothetical protein Tco_1388076 [Tanacetum coccineum]